MVQAQDARRDLNEILTQTITYRKYTDQSIDLATGQIDEQQYNDYQIDAQCTVQNIDDQQVQLGNLEQGDLVAFLRHEYTEETDGTSISPALVPDKRDKIQFLGNWYRIQETTPATSEGQGIVGYDITAVKDDSDVPQSQ